MDKTIDGQIQMEQYSNILRLTDSLTFNKSRQFHGNTRDYLAGKHPSRTDEPSIEAASDSQYEGYQAPVVQGIPEHPVTIFGSVLLNTCRSCLIALTHQQHQIYQADMAWTKTTRDP